MPDVSTSLPLLSIAITVLLAVAFVIAFLGNKGKGLSEVQNNTILALQAQNAAQEKQMQIQDRQIKTLERKLERLERTLDTAQDLLKKRRGLLLEINDDLVTLTDQRSGTEHTVKIKIDSDELPTIEKEK